MVDPRSDAQCQTSVHRLQAILTRGLRENIVESTNQLVLSPGLRDYPRKPSMRLMMWTRAIAAVLAGLITFAAAATSAEPVKIRVGWVNVPGQITPILFAHP